MNENGKNSPVVAAPSALDDQQKPVEFRSSCGFFCVTNCFAVAAVKGIDSTVPVALIALVLTSGFHCKCNT